MKRCLSFCLVIVLCTCFNGVKTYAKEEPNNAKTFLMQNNIIGSDGVEASFELLGGEYAIQSLRVIDENHFESTVTYAYGIVEGQFIRVDIRPFSDVSGNETDKAVLVTARMSYSKYNRSYYNQNLSYISPYALSVVATGPNDLSISYMYANLEAYAKSYAFPECLDYSYNTDVSQYILDDDGYFMEFSQSNPIPGRSYGDTQFMDGKILGFTGSTNEYIGALVSLNTNKGNISRIEIEFTYKL